MIPFTTSDVRLYSDCAIVCYLSKLTLFVIHTSCEASFIVIFIEYCLNQARAQAGASCTNALCVTGTRCLEVGQGSGDFRCVPTTALENAMCGSVQTGLCAGRMQCVGNAMGAACRRPATTGMSCDPQRTTGPSCNIFQNEVCNSTMGPGTCVAANWVGGGSSCAPPNLCNQSAACDQTNMQCVALPGEMQTCNMGNCAPGLWCNVATCERLKVMGSQCMRSDECQDNLLCISGTCQPLTYTFCP